jgi:hypothetical protein
MKSSNKSAKLIAAVLVTATMFILQSCGGSSEPASTQPGGTGNPGGTTQNPAIALSLSPVTTSVRQTELVAVVATVARSGGFTGDVTITAEGAPTGMTVGVGSVATSGTSTTASVSFSPAPSVAVGTYNITIRAKGTGVADVTATLQLQVTAGPTQGGNVSVDLSACLPNTITWFAAQDGSGAWTRISGATDVYKFSVITGKGGFAWVSDLNGAKTLHIRFATQAELTAAPLVLCTAIGTKTVHGTVSGLTSSEFGTVTLTNQVSVASVTSPAYTFFNVKDGPHDLTAYKWASPDVLTDRLIIRRDQNIANNGSASNLDLSGGSAEGVNTATANFALVGVQSIDNLTFATGYLTGASCDVSLFKIWAPPAATGTLRNVTVQGVPAAQQRPTDFHEILVTTGNGGENPGTLMLGTQTPFAILPPARTTRLFLHTLANDTLTLGAPFGVPPTVTTIPGAYTRLQAQLTIPADYQSSATLDFGTGQSNPSVTLTASFGWLGSSTPTLTVPDFTSVAGWSNAWAPVTGTAVAWSVTATGTNITNTQCVDHGFIKTLRSTGGTG